MTPKAYLYVGLLLRSKYSCHRENTSKRMGDQVPECTSNLRQQQLDTTIKVRKTASIRIRYIQVPHLFQDTKWESIKMTIKNTNKSQEASFTLWGTRTQTNQGTHIQAIIIIMIIIKQSLSLSLSLSLSNLNVKLEMTHITKLQINKDSTRILQDQLKHENTRYQL